MCGAVITSTAIDEIIKELKKAKVSRHRRIIVLIGDDDSRLITACLEILDAIYKHFRNKGAKLLYIYHAFYEDGTVRKRMFESTLTIPYVVEYIPYHETERVLGQTYSLAIVDLMNNIEPNDVGRISGIVEGGGLYIFLMPNFKTLMNIVTRFQSNLLTPQYDENSLRRFFEQRFINKLLEHNGIAIYDTEKKTFVKRFGRTRITRFRRHELVFPRKPKIPLKVFSLAITQDQVNVLSLLDEFYRKADEKLVLVLTADRGRGKSSVIGLGLGGLAHKLRKAKGRCRVIVTSPSELNVQEVFRFAKIALETLGHEIRVEERGGRIIAIRSKAIDIEYYPPLHALKRRADIIAVDEAASLHVPMLFAILKRFDKIIYSSTIHGYEGAGRGFSVRFLGSLRKLSGIKILEYEMDEPIRYAKNDPIEKWIFNTLLLDAEPAELSEEDFTMVEQGEIEYYIPSLEKFFLENEEELRQFFGIYIMAHYRNNPNDLGIMMDAPHHFVRALRLKNGKIVVSLELAEEGPLLGKIAYESAKGAWIMGNIVPDRLIKHYKLIDFGKFKGIRVVRIATHPEVMRKGLGSKALEMLEEEFREKGYDWIGAGFGVTKELLNFWIKNGYIPVHMSPERNPVSGEYSVIVIKPLREEVYKYIEVIAWEFKKKILGSLPEPYHDLDPRTVIMLVKSTPKKKYLSNLSIFQIARFMSYAWGEMTLENCMDVMVELSKRYFFEKGDDELTILQKLLLITRVLQAKSWRVTCEELGISPPSAMEEVRKAAKILSRLFLDVASEKDAERFLYLSLERQ